MLRRAVIVGKKLKLIAQTLRMQCLDKDMPHRSYEQNIQHCCCRLFIFYAYDGKVYTLHWNNVNREYLIGRKNIREKAKFSIFCILSVGPWWNRCNFLVSSTINFTFSFIFLILFFFLCLQCFVFGPVHCVCSCIHLEIPFTLVIYGNKINIILCSVCNVNVNVYVCVRLVSSRRLHVYCYVLLQLLTLQQ